MAYAKYERNMESNANSSQNDAIPMISNTAYAKYERNTDSNGSRKHSSQNDVIPTSTNAAYRINMKKNPAYGLTLPVRTAEGSQDCESYSDPWHFNSNILSTRD